MATFTSISLMVTLLLAICSAAPNKDLALKIPDECKGKGFCTIKPEGYDEMQQMAKKLMSAYFVTQNFGDRIGDGIITKANDTDAHNCPFIEKTETVYAYSHDDKSSPDYFIQNELHSITCDSGKIEKTKQGNQECFQKLGLARTKNTCVTSTAKRGLLVFDVEKQEIKKKYYDVNCCCSCQLNSSL